MIAGLCLAGNEADIIEAFVRHNLAHVDVLRVIMHRSFDGTHDILARLGRELPALQLSEALHADFRQGEEITASARDWLRANPDISHIVLLDADEFIACDDSDHLRRALPSAPAAGTPCLMWRSYVPMGTADPRAIGGLCHRRKHEDYPIAKVILDRRFIEPGRSVAEGCHREIVRREGTIEYPALLRVRGVELAHFPIRSAAQITAKVLVGSWNRRRQQTAGLAYHWQAIYDALRSGRDLTEAKLTELAFNYSHLPAIDAARPDDLVVDPIPLPPGMPERHAAPASPLPVLMAWVEAQMVGSPSDGAPPSNIG